MNEQRDGKGALADPEFTREAEPEEQEVSDADLLAISARYRRRR